MCAPFHTQFVHAFRHTLGPSVNSVLLLSMMLRTSSSYSGLADVVRLLVLPLPCTVLTTVDMVRTLLRHVDVFSPLSFVSGTATEVAIIVVLLGVLVLW